MSISCVEGLQSRPARRHICESPHPHEAVGIVEVAKGAQDVCAHGLLRLDEHALEQRDQFVAASSRESEEGYTGDSIWSTKVSRFGGRTVYAGVTK
jgi:hypothetical protein